MQAEKTRDAAETTEKYGLEAGLWQVFSGKGGSKDGKGKGAQAKDLLARYGSAYLITSISFAIVSFGACYALVSSGECGHPLQPPAACWNYLACVCCFWLVDEAE